MNKPTIHLFHQSLKKGGGFQRYCIIIAAAFKNLGYDVVVDARASDPRLAKSLGVKVNIVKVPRFLGRLRALIFFFAIEKLRTRVSGKQVALSRVCASDLVMCGGTHRGYLQHTNKFPGVSGWLQIWLENRAYSSCRTVISHSDLCTLELTKLYGVPEKKIVTLYPPVEWSDDSEKMPSGSDCRQKFGLPKDKFVFLFPSMDHKRKGLAPICKAIAGHFENVILAVAGRPARKHKWPFVHNLGYVDDMTEAYRAADFTILGSYYEPFGMVGPESVMCGTRVVLEENMGCSVDSIVRPFHERLPSRSRGSIASVSRIGLCATIRRR